MANIFDLFKQIDKGGSSAVSALPVEYVVAGLGNPGTEYALTRHNAGFMAIDYIAERTGVHVDRARFKALTAVTNIAGKSVLLIKPQTFMNNSGEAVGEAVRFYKLASENVIVLSDDISLDVGRLRLRRKGSAGGHNGLKSIEAHLGSAEYPRIKLGVGEKPHPDYDLAAWVLSSFDKRELEVLSQTYPKIFVGIEKLISGDTEGAMQLCNGK